MLVKFGDVFKYKSEKYVYLARTEDVLYATKILSLELSRELHNVYENECKKDHKRSVLENKPLYCFVTLNTKAFKDRIAHIGTTKGMDDSLFFDIADSLNSEDLKAIKEEILTGPLPKMLKELVLDIDLPC
ncbi:MAG: hypothetical protein UW24_C0007G0006 [Parcubacteria group bacterium GW2011_GWA2_44_12]|nr:MAG: hypothetical protein UW24_C0007G0006 [Parcubacteria group bacterium GW2011_GWA2_44_12]